MRLFSGLPTSRGKLRQVKVKLFSDRLPLAYFAGLLSVILFLVLLPLVYLGLVVLIGWLLQWHIQNNLYLLFGYKVNILQALLFSFQTLTLGLFLFFLVYPLFHIPKETNPDLALSDKLEPRLYAFLNQICIALGAKTPQKIYVNMDINASARFVPGWSGLIKGELELILGLPLVSGLELEQFVAVLSHELGHFRQGFAMRLVQGARIQNQWFANAAGQEFIWEGNFKARPRRYIGLTYLPGWFACLCRWGIQKCHVGFIHLGQLSSSMLLRQMEYEADRAAIRMVGGETFAEMILQARVLDSAWGLANRSLGLALREGKLADDFPALVSAHTRVFIPEIRRKMERSLVVEKAVWFDTHPSLGERILRARQARFRGMFHAKGKAHGLFTDYSGLSKRTTLEFYQKDLGKEFNPARLIPTSVLVTGQSQIQIGEAALSGYFLGLLSNLKPIFIFISDLKFPQSDSLSFFVDLRENLQVARSEIESQFAIAAQNYRELSLCDGKIIDAIQAMALMRANFSIEPGDFQLRSGGIAQAALALDAAEALKLKCMDSLSNYEIAMRNRLISALGLLSDPIVLKYYPDARLEYGEVLSLLPGLKAMSEVQTQLDSLRRAWFGLGILLDNDPGHGFSDDFERHCLAHAQVINLEMESIRKHWSQYEYPFQPLEKGLDLATYAFDAPANESEYRLQYLAAEDTLGRCYAFYFRIMGQLALSAGRVEGFLGLGTLRVHEGRDGD